MRQRYGTQNTPQSNFGRSNGEREYQRLQQLILDKTGVSCTVLCTPNYVSIKAGNYAEFVMAKAAIRGRVSVEIIQAPEK